MTNLQVSGPATIPRPIPSPPLLDSGANGHFLKDKRRYNSEPTPVRHRTMTSASGNKRKIRAKGKAGRLRDALLVEGLTTEMISISKLHDDTKRFITFGPEVSLGAQARPVTTSRCCTNWDTHHEWPIRCRRKMMSDEHQYIGALSDILPDNNIHLIHARLGHVSYRTIAHAIESGKIKGLHVTKAEMQQLKQNKGPLCIACGLGSTIKRKLAKNMTGLHLAKPTKPFELLCIDICGPVKPQSMFGDTYFIIVIDVYTNSIWTIPIRSRADAAKALDDFLENMANSYRTNLKCIMTIRTDGAKELTQGKITEVYRKWKMQMKETTSPHSSYQNANAERAIRTTVTMATAMMLHAQAPKREWIYALRTATYILRRLPTTANPDRKAPVQMTSNSDQPVNLALLRTWYSPVFVRKQDPETNKRQRFEERGWAGTFMGYQEGVKGYLVRINGKIYPRGPRDVYFVEDMAEAKKMRDESRTEQTKTSFTIRNYEQYTTNDDKEQEREEKHTPEEQVPEMCKGKTQKTYYSAS